MATGRASRPAWTHSELDAALDTALKRAVAISSSAAYTVALNSYIDFCSKHTFPTHPTPETFARYVVWMSKYVSPRTVNSYLSGICNRLEGTYPNVREVRSSVLVSNAMKGCMRMRNVAVKRKRALTNKF